MDICGGVYFKNGLYLELTRHRNAENFFGNTFAAFGADYFMDRKPSVIILREK